MVSRQQPGGGIVESRGPEAASSSIEMIREVVVIVLSILIAFALDAGWEAQQDKSRAREILNDLASEAARKSLVKVALREGRTLHHDVRGRNGAGKVLLRSAPAGTGIIAGGPVRAICEMSGIQDVVGKSIGSSNPYNLVRASFDALTKQKSPKEISLIRGKKIKEIVSRR